MRVGQGFDAHAFEDGRTLVLGGIAIPHDRGLAGHSDGDVLLHAIIDALLGAAALGDIGEMFPSSDRSLKGADSKQLLTDVCSRVRAEGHRISNIDATAVLQQPRLAPHIGAMRECIAISTQIDITCVSVKATTTDAMGFTGRREGIAAFATVLLE